MTDSIRDLIIQMRTPELTELEQLAHKTLHTLIAMRFVQGRLDDETLNRCTDPECPDCGRIICPYHEPLHFHHDGCPACSTGKFVEY